MRVRNTMRVALAIGLIAVVAGFVAATGQRERAAEWPVTLEVFSGPANQAGYMEGWWVDLLEEEIGVRLELLAGAEGRWDALVAAGDLAADVVVFPGERELEDSIRANLLLNLDDHLDRLPNVAQYARQSLQFHRDMRSADTGIAFAVGNTIGPSPVGADTNFGPYLRWDLYKELGMPAVETRMDYLHLLKQMQELEPVNADGQPVYGISLWPDWDGNHMFLAHTYAIMRGVDTGEWTGSIPFTQVDYNTGELSSILDADSHYIEALRFYFEANQMGLLDPDSLTQRFDTAWQKMQQGRVLYAPWPWFAGAYNTPERINADPPKGFRPVFPEGYRAYWTADNPIGRGWSFAIPRTTDKLDAALRYVDYMYSPDGLMQLFNGPRGVVWDVDPSTNKPFVTETGWEIIEERDGEMPGGGLLAEGTSIVNSYGLSGAFVHPEFGVPLAHAFWDDVLVREPPKLYRDWSETTGYLTPSQMVWDKGRYTMEPLGRQMLPSPPDDLQIVIDRVGDVVKNNSWLMVLARNEAEFQRHYEDMVNRARGLGIDQILERNARAWTEAMELAAAYE